MNKPALRSPRGRKPKWLAALLYRPHCRDCPLRRPSGECRDSGLWSGRCGDYVWYVVRGQQRRRLYVKPNNPQRRRQQRWRTRFGAASRNYSASLTDEQQQACIAAGAKVPCRPRLGPSGVLTGQQYSVRGELASGAARRRKQTARATQVARRQGLTKKYTSEVPQPQALTRSAPDTHRGITGATPAPHHRNTRAARRDIERSGSSHKHSHVSAAVLLVHPGVCSLQARRFVVIAGQSARH